MIFAFLVRMPIFLAHLWLPRAHVEAPVSASIILAGVLLSWVVMFYCMFLMFWLIFLV
jgi:NADH:ubiquinone oxidoreductase subunit 4 (subunit M)